MIDISVVTPTFNRAHLLPRVWRSLSSQDASFEWVVIDDASSDDTRAVVDSLGDRRIVYKGLPVNRGVGAARNEGASIARGRYVVFLDSDDEAIPGSLGRAAEAMDRAVGSIGVAAFVCVIAETGRPVCELVDGKVLDERAIICEGALDGGDKILVYRREVFEEFRLPETFQGCEHVFVYGLSKKWEFLLVNEPMSLVHRQQDNLSGAASVVRRSLDIARSFEVVISNHGDALAACPGAEFKFLKKAMYRYGVARSRRDVLRVYRSILQKHSLLRVVSATAMVVPSLLGLGRFELWRANMLNRRFSSRHGRSRN
jgi:glycosyltransferase involved in cell wall biosynthesis